MRFFKGWLLASALVVFFLIAAPAQAGFVTASLDTTNTLAPSAPVTINYGDGKTPSLNYTPGEVNWTLSSNTSNIVLPTHFVTFCIELGQDISTGTPYQYSVVTVDKAPQPGSSQTGNGNGMGTYKAGEIAKLWGAYYSSIGNSGDMAAGMQLAMWKIEYDWSSSSQSTSFSSGNFQATDTSNNAITDATNMLKYVIAHDNTLQGAPNLWALSSGNAQDQIVQALPVPSSAWLAGIGALCLLAYGYFRRAYRPLPSAGASV